MDNLTITIVVKDDEQIISTVPLIDPVIADALTREGRQAVVEAARKAAQEATHLATAPASQ